MMGSLLEEFLGMVKVLLMLIAMNTMRKATSLKMFTFCVPKWWKNDFIRN